ncbi:MBL fold metallo-hydrolase [Oceanobacillus halophilus]|uniref:MBL fold metallo-hydrolase n=1 Tax=Oceanobacillus halophilus TaxID=930130 RepID=A0A494ZXK9_9BACI|nr:MBL fold metallo-hydrolase [Oceanobacillus halophilus]RKQ31297.1 MBL fold metallo-hydrolase [Oceanobacillus halophilus]
MKLTVIGCWGGYPAKDGATSSYLLEKDNFSLLIDVGSGALSKLQKYKQVADIDAVIISHYHHDHVADIGVLQYARLIEYYVTGKNAVLPIYGHDGDKEGFESLSHTYTKGVNYDPTKTLELGPFSITFLKTNHPVPCYGMRITDGESVIVYTADSSYQEEWGSFAKEANLLITDCNYYAGLDGSKAGHMNSEEAGKIAAQANVELLMLSHLPQYGEISKLVKEAKQKFDGQIKLAREGFVWNG